MSLPSGSVRSLTGNDPDLVARVLGFLKGIGIPCRYGNVGRSFINNVFIKDGGLVINSKSVVADILHEAGHIAIIPSNLRHHAKGDLEALELEVSKALDAITYDQWANDDPAAKALLQLSDTEATAWAWAAGKHLDIPEPLIIEDEHYDGNGASMRIMLGVGQYLGINGMVASRMLSKISDYPILQRWTQI